MAVKSVSLLLFVIVYVSATTKFIPEAANNDLTCYIDPIWDKSDIQVFKDIQYGSAYNMATNSTQTLLLDAYLPPNSDQRESKPAVVFIHGGAFVSGNKDGQGDVDFVMELAIRGYTCVSIDYRLTGNFWPWPTEKAVLDAQEDARAAVRFLRKNAQQYHLDTERIVIMGESAGAATTLWLAYAKNAQYEGDSGNPGFTSKVAGVLAISGEMKVQSYCDGVILGKPYGCKINFPEVDVSGDIGSFSG